MSLFRIHWGRRGWEDSRDRHIADLESLLTRAWVHLETLSSDLEEAASAERPPTQLALAAFAIRTRHVQHIIATERQT